MAKKVKDMPEASRMIVSPGYRAFTIFNDILIGSIPSSNFFRSNFIENSFVGVLVLLSDSISKVNFCLSIRIKK